MIGIRGAICAEDNSRGAIYRATQRLLGEIVSRNDLTLGEICAAMFTMTPDLNADFPAYAARDMGWTTVPMLGAQETLVPGSPERAIRVLVLADVEPPAHHVYLGRAAAMRPDLVEPGDAERWNGSSEERVADESEGGSLGRLLVIGLGLIGGSIAAASRRSTLFSEVVGYDRDPASAQLALRRGLVDSLGNELGDEVRRADMVVLAVPVIEIVDLLPSLGGWAKEGVVITDVGSTKRRITEAMAGLPERVRAVGGHPIAGSTASGPGAAHAELFRGARWALVTTARSDDVALAQVERLVRALGAEPVNMSAELHDQVVAVTSHLPAAMSVALVNVASGLHKLVADEEILAGPGFRGASRLAAGDPTMTAQMLSDNSDNLTSAINAGIQALEEMRKAICADEGALRERLARARELRKSLVADPVCLTTPTTWM